MTVQFFNFLIYNLCMIYKNYIEPKSLLVKWKKGLQNSHPFKIGNKTLKFFSLSCEWDKSPFKTPNEVFFL